MEKRSIFNHRLLPYALLLPQIVITLVFFYWPASQAVWQSFLLQDAFGLSTAFIWFENYLDLFSQPEYYRTIATTLKTPFVWRLAVYGSDMWVESTSETCITAGRLIVNLIGAAVRANYFDAPPA